MNDDAHHNAEPDGESSKPASIAGGLAGFLLLVTVCVAVLLLASGLLVWGTRFAETWLGLPAMSILGAFLGLSLVVTVLVAQGRIVTAIREHWDPFRTLADHVEWDGIDEDDEGDKEEEEK